MVTNEHIHAIEQDVIDLARKLLAFEKYIAKEYMQLSNKDSLGTLHVNLYVLEVNAHRLNEIVKRKRSLL